MTQFLTLIDGKKAQILAIVGLILSFLVTAGTITPAVGTLIQGILSILSGGAEITTVKLGLRK